MNNKNNFKFNNGVFRVVEDLEYDEDLETFIDSLNLPFEGEIKGDEYVVALGNSNDFSKIYNIISTNKDLNLKDGSTANDSEARFLFLGDNFEISLLANFDDDIYRLAVSKA